MRIALTLILFMSLVGCGEQMANNAEPTASGETMLMRSLHTDPANPDYLKFVHTATPCKGVTLEGSWQGMGYLFADSCHFTNIDCNEIGTFEEISADSVLITVTEQNGHVNPHNCLGVGKWECEFWLDNYHKGAKPEQTTGTLRTDCHHATEGN